MAVFQGTERYVVLRYLGSGSFGEVFEVFDRERQTKIALKVPHETTAGGLYYFKREFRSLVDVTHPNLVALYELVGDRDRWFFTMELVEEGISFRDYLQATGQDERASHPSRPPLPGFASTPPTGSWNFLDSLHTQSFPTVPLEPGGFRGRPQAADAVGLAPDAPPVNFQTVRILLRQLAEGLIALHHAGKLHRDLKPSNILVTPEGHLTILDFGLVIETARPVTDDNLATHLIGTPAYMSPEQLEGRRGTEASDWYSVGIMLYEALTGRLPFEGTLIEMVRQKIELDPDPPSQRVAGIPEDLDLICLQLLERNPELRLTGVQLLERLRGCNPFPKFEISAPGSLPLLLGRDQELATLFKTFEASRSGRPTLVQVQGGSGTGKTLLIRHFIHELQHRDPGVLILQGRCYEQESVPYKAVDPVIDELSRHLAHLPKTKADALVPRNVHALTRLFPVLNRIKAFIEASTHPAEADDAKTMRRRAFFALRDLLSKLGERHPLVIIIDDLQWGDLDSANLLRELLNPPDPPDLLLVVSYRSEEAATAPALVELFSTPVGIDTVPLPLGEFTPEVSERLAMALIGPETAGASALAKRIAQDSAGNPFFIGELAHHQQTGLAERSDPLDSSLYGYIRQRVAALPDDAQRILETLALAGHPLSWEVVRKSSALEGAKLPPASLLRAGRLVRTRRTRDHQALEIYHDFVRRAVLWNMGGTQRRQRHLRLAEVLEACGEGEPETLAQHYILAGESQKAADFTARAGDKSAATFAFKGAVDLYRRSLALRPASDPEQPVLLLKLADVLSSAGRGQEAAGIYLQLASVLDPADGLRLQRRAAEEFFRSGHFDQGVATLGPVLSAIRMRLASTPFLARLSTAWYSLILRLRGYEFSERRAQDIPPGELERVDICWTAVQGLGTSALMRGMDMQVRHLLLALKVGEPSRIIRALAHQAMMESMRGSQTLVRALRHQSLSIALAEKHGDPKLIGYACMNSGIGAMLQGRWTASASLLERAKDIFLNQCVGVASELHQVHHHLLSVHFILGHFEELQRNLPDLIRDAEERGDLLAEANLKTGYSLFHHLAMDDPESARQKLKRAQEIWSSREFHSQHWQALYLGGLIDQYAGRPELPWELLNQQRKGLETSRLLNVQYIRLSWFEHIARTALAYARTLQAGNPNRARALKVARSAIRAIGREEADYGRAAYMKLRGIETAVCGRTKDAVMWFDRAETAYQSCQMPLHAHIAKWCRGKLLGSDGQVLVTEAEIWMTRQGIINHARYANMHAPCTDMH